jgi:deoxyribonuclease-4
MMIWSEYMLVIGPHISIAKGYTKAVKDAINMRANTFQFFSRNPRGSNFRAYEKKDVTEFQKLRRENNFGPIQAHAPYTMNLASSDSKVYEFGNKVIKEDIKRMDDLDIEYMVFHPGSHVGIGVDKGIEQIANALNNAINGKENITILLETMTGKGTEVGFRFEHLKRVIDLVEYKNKLGICMDLCHVFSAGYDIKNDLNGILEEMDKQVGIERLKTIHLNDSMLPFNSRKDRHTPVGEGEIGLDTIIYIMQHPYIKNLPFYIETPLDNDGHKREIEMIKNLLKL